MSSMVFNEGSWLPLVDYAVRHGLSISTVRRYIKGRKVQSRLVEGKYLILDQGKPEFTEMSIVSTNDGQLRRLEQELQRAREEVAELKMLVAIYEEQLAHRS